MFTVYYNMLNNPVLLARVTSLSFDRDRECVKGQI